MYSFEADGIKGALTTGETGDFGGDFGGEANFTSLFISENKIKVSINNKYLTYFLNIIIKLFNKIICFEESFKDFLGCPKKK